MQRLQTPDQAAQWLRERVTGVLCTDNRQVQTNDGFIAWPGAAHDARRFVPIALEQGASACLMWVCAYVALSPTGQGASPRGLKFPGRVQSAPLPA